MRCEDYLSILAYQSVLEDCPGVPGACAGDAALNSSGQAAVVMSSALLVPSSSSRTQLPGEPLPRQLLQCQAENDCAPRGVRQVKSHQGTRDPWFGSQESCLR